MSVCVFTRGCARALICALAMGAADVAAQEAPAEAPAKDSEPTPVQVPAEAPAEPAKTEESAPAGSKPESKIQAAPSASPLPSLVIDAPKVVTTTKKIKGKTSAAAPAIAGSEPAPEVPGIVYGTTFADTGTTTFDSRNVNMRTNGGGDANTFLRNLPNVQYQNDTDKDPGASAAKSIDTKPLLLSINGGRTYENNFILNGVSINNITGPVESNATNLTDNELTPNANGIYGLHPQQVFVPSEFIGQATLIDSNASAEYGQFQGGVVIYDLAKPPTDGYHASVTYSRQTSDMINYILATPTGININNRVAPTFEKNNLAASVGAPITSDWSFIAQVSRKTADTTKQKSYYISDDFVDEDSDNLFYRFATSVRTDIGKFTLDTSITDYTQHWVNPFGRDLYIDTATDSSSTQLEYLADLPGVRLDDIGVGRVKLKSRVYYNDSETTNTSGDSVAYNWYNQRLINYNPATGWSEQYDTTLHDDWCRGVNPATQPSNGGGLFNCREGGYGNRLLGQTDLGVQAHLSGNVLLGNFKVGAEATQTEGRRARLEDYIFVAVNTVATASNTPAGVINCAPGDNLCDKEQFASSITNFAKFDVSAIVNSYHTYAELDQTWQWFNVRAGVRAEYDDYFENINIAPRLAGTITPFDGLSFTGGYNRYYLGESLYYAVRDQQARGLTYNRSIDTATGIPKAFTPLASGVNQFLNYKAAGLDTPYSDEYTGTVRVKDPFLDGLIRLRYLERYGKDRFAEAACTMPGVIQCYELTNNGESYYRSATAEYTKAWRHLDTPIYLSGLAITGDVTWSEQTTSRGSYLNSANDPDGDTEENYILYNGQSYSPVGFNDVTGNLDIPVRLEATLSTNWFNDRLWVDFSAGYNLGYQGVYDTGVDVLFNGRDHDVYDDKTFKAALMLDVTAQFAVTEQAYISARVNNILNTAGNAVTTYDNPWVVGRTVWLESGLRF